MAFEAKFEGTKQGRKKKKLKLTIKNVEIRTVFWLRIGVKFRRQALPFLV